MLDFLSFIFRQNKRNNDINHQIFRPLLLSAVFLLFGPYTVANAVEITQATIDHSAKTLDVSGIDFDKTISTPKVWIDEHQLSVDTYSSSLITASFGSSYDEIFDNDPPVELDLNLVVILEITEIDQDDDGNDVEVSGFESDEYCLGVPVDDPEFECEFTSGNLVPSSRKVKWRIPNIPQGDEYADFNYKFGPAKINDQLNKWGDPVYFQLMNDYEISLEDYLNDYPLNNFGDKLLDRCSEGNTGIPLQALKNRLNALSGKKWQDTTPPGDDPYIEIQDGILKIKKGYRWDGPSIEAFNIRLAANPASLIRSSFIHDSIYDLMRLKVIEQFGVRVVFTNAWYNRKLADCMIYMLSRQDNSVKSKARVNYSVIRTFGAGRTKNDPADWLFHATADAGEDESTVCAPNGPGDFTLHGENSNDAESYMWEVTDPDGDLVTFATGASPQVSLIPGAYVANLTVGPGSKTDSIEQYKDTDDAEIMIAPDTVAPDFLLADDITVPNDPGQCSANVDFKVIATDDCGTPTITCKSLPDNIPVPVSAVSEFPVAATQVECEAKDVNQSTIEEVVVTVNDVEPPEMNGITAPICIWPPNKRYMTFAISDFVKSVSDNCTESNLVDLNITGVTSDEVDDDSSDIVIATDGKSVQVRRERLGSGNGRVYTVYIEANDNSVNFSFATFQVHVPVDKQCRAIDDGSA